MIRGTDFIDVAGKLAARPAATEAELRTAIGRAYYGAVHAAHAFIATLGIDLKVTIHELHRYLSNSGNLQAKLAGDAVAELQSKRVRADYRLEEELARHGGDPLKYARLCVEAARQVESMLGACRHEPARTQVRTGIEEFLKRDPKHGGPARTSAN